jgi:hypothetical protein
MGASDVRPSVACLDAVSGKANIGRSNWSSTQRYSTITSLPAATAVELQPIEDQVRDIFGLTPLRR